MTTKAECCGSLRPEERFQVSYDDFTVECLGVTYSIPEEFRTDIVFNYRTRLFPCRGVLCVRYYVEMFGTSGVAMSAQLPELEK
jgi:hypothetical protein